MEKKSIWDVLDSVLPSAASVYGKIREKETGVDPFSALRNPEEEAAAADSLNAENPIIKIDSKKRNTIWYVLGGLTLVGVGTYFILKKIKK